MVPYIPVPNVKEIKMITKVGVWRPLLRRTRLSSSATPPDAGLPPPRPTLISTLGYFAAGAVALAAPLTAFGWIFQSKADERDWPLLVPLAPGHFVKVPALTGPASTSAPTSFFSTNSSSFSSSSSSSISSGGMPSDCIGAQHNQRSAHVVIRGSGTPLVILEASTGGLTQDFAKCIDEIAKFTTVFAYDRHGLGFSSEQDAGVDMSASVSEPNRRNARQLRIELDEVLNGIPELKSGDSVTSGGVIVVGHGQGGVIAMNLAADCAAKRSETLNGVVLFESACGVREKQRGISKEIAAAIDSMAEGAQSLASLSKFGVARMMMNTQKSIDSLSLSYRQGDCSIVQALSSRTNHCEAVAAEVACYAEDDSLLESLVESCTKSGETVAAGDRGPGGFRALVVSHGDAEMFRELATLGAATPETAQERLNTLEDIWQHGQADLAAILSRSSFHVQARGCTHDMPQRHPEMVIDAVRAMVDAVRSDSESPLLKFHGKYHDERGSRGTTSYYNYQMRKL